jgi:hypothetical protein
MVFFNAFVAFMAFMAFKTAKRCPGIVTTKEVAEERMEVAFSDVPRRQPSLKLTSEGE